MSTSLERRLSALGLVAISIVLVIAFADQFLLHELPCPLCLLQRVGFVLAGMGLALNLTTGIRSANYALTILGAMAGAAVALRQVALHVIPGSGAYGSALLGMHLYTWAFVLFAVIIAGSAVMLLWSRQPAGGSATDNGAGAAPQRPLSSRVALLLFGAVVLANGVSTLAECGIGLCPDNPVDYEAFGALKTLLSSSGD